MSIRDLCLMWNFGFGHRMTLLKRNYFEFNSMSKILVVEDSLVQRELMATLLRNNHFEIATASNGLEAIAQVQFPI